MEKLSLDTVKGNPGSFRGWDYQLRAPLLLSTADAVIERAPLPQYLHQTNVLDTSALTRPRRLVGFEGSTGGAVVKRAYDRIKL